jgi:hypothetical protein
MRNSKDPSQIITSQAMISHLQAKVSAQRTHAAKIRACECSLLAQSYQALPHGTALQDIGQYCLPYLEVGIRGWIGL